MFQKQMQKAFGGGTPNPPQSQGEQRKVPGEVKIKYIEEKNIEELEDRVNNFIEEVKDMFKEAGVTQFPMPSVVHMVRGEKVLAIITYVKIVK